MEYAIYNYYYLNNFCICEEEQKYGKRLKNDIEKVITNISSRNPVKLNDNTPAVLILNGIKNLPIYENPAHIRKNILSYKQAKKLGLQINKRDNYHGLGIDLFIEAINSIDNPQSVFKNQVNNDYLVITKLEDSKGNIIVIPMETDTTTNINKKRININRIKSIYGFNNSHGYSLDEYIAYNIINNKFKEIYSQKKEQGTGFSTAASSHNKNISHHFDYVNSVEKNTKNGL